MIRATANYSPRESFQSLIFSSIRKDPSSGSFLMDIKLSGTTYGLCESAILSIHLNVDLLGGAGFLIHHSWIREIRKQNLYKLPLVLD